MKSRPITFTISTKPFIKLQTWIILFLPYIIMALMSALSIGLFIFFLNNNLGLAYNDARSHLDIGRRVVEGLKPGLAQLGSVWLPLPHALMIPTIWNDFFWHTGLSGAIQSMISFVLTGYIIYRILERLHANISARIFGVVLFSTNLNILYLQSTAMTELLLLATMTIAVYELIKWHDNDEIFSLLKSAGWVMLSTLIRYDGWFLFFYGAMLIVLRVIMQDLSKIHPHQHISPTPQRLTARRIILRLKQKVSFYVFILKKWQIGKTIGKAEGMFILFCTLGGFGLFMWVVWNWAIFKDPLYFAFGPFSAHAQQNQLEQAGVLLTKKDIWLSLKTYWFAMVFNLGVIPILFGFIGSILLFLDKKIKPAVRIASSALYAPLIFNVLALYLGHSVLFVQNLNGNTWFNVRYGIMMMPSIAIFAGFLFYKAKSFRPLLVGLMIFFAFFHIVGKDAVTIDDGRVGSSQKNVSEVSGWLEKNTANRDGFVLISAASHDAIIFSSNMPMKKFIHEGTGTYWESATTTPDRWARWIVMRTNDANDLTYKTISKADWQDKYTLIHSYPFADIYELKEEYLDELNTKPVLGKQK